MTFKVRTLVLFSVLLIGCVCCGITSCGRQDEADNISKDRDTVERFAENAKEAFSYLGNSEQNSVYVVYMDHEGCKVYEGNDTHVDRASVFYYGLEPVIHTSLRSQARGVWFVVSKNGVAIYEVVRNVNKPGRLTNTDLPIMVTKTRPEV